MVVKHETAEEKWRRLSTHYKQLFQKSIDNNKEIQIKYGDNMFFIIESFEDTKSECEQCHVSYNIIYVTGKVRSENHIYFFGEIQSFTSYITPWDILCQCTPYEEDAMPLFNGMINDLVNHLYCRYLE